MIPVTKSCILCRPFPRFGALPRPILQTKPEALNSSIQRVGLIVKALSPAIAKMGSKSTPLKSGLWSFSQRPRNTIEVISKPPNISHAFVRQVREVLFLGSLCELSGLCVRLKRGFCNWLNLQITQSHNQSNIQTIKQSLNPHHGLAPDFHRECSAARNHIRRTRTR